MKHEISSSRTSFDPLSQHLEPGDLLVGHGAVVTHVNDRGSLIKVEIESLNGEKLPRLEFGYDVNVTIR